ncbi:hypothetical protein Y1Q_0015984 [Alligator mississippiensis]|uniref:Uncharacterized protein n=1 Tax=Alligator mississippiensis TaxID=8496 RepID=A0A151MV62_ALLMI|nr:hypothetical protein Y1Q_0015984 [Alligator mississippiensis]
MPWKQELRTVFNSLNQPHFCSLIAIHQSAWCMPAYRMSLLSTGRFLVSPLCLGDVRNPHVYFGAFPSCGSAPAAPSAQHGLTPALFGFYPSL